MRKVWVIAVREFMATVRTKAFMVTIILMPVMMAGGAIVGIITKKLEDRGEKTFVVIDRTPGERMIPALEKGLERRNKEDITDKKTGARTAPLFKIEKAKPRSDTREAIDDLRLELSHRVKLGHIAGFLEIGPDVLKPSTVLGTIAGMLGMKNPPKPTGIKVEENAEKKDNEDKNDPAATRFQSKPTVTGAAEFYRFARDEITRVVVFDRLERIGVAAWQLPILTKRIDIYFLGLTTKSAEGKIQDDEGGVKTAAPMITAGVMMVLMFMIIMVGATPLMQSVLEEKMQRIAEVLLGSVRPIELMLGKLLGSVGVSLVLAAVYIGGAYWAVYQYGFADQVPMMLIISYLYFQVLGLLMYGSLFIAVGAACTDMKEPQALMLPVMLPAMIPLFLIGPIFKEPDGLVAVIVSYFPPTTPMLMVTRQALNAGIQWWEPFLGGLIVLAATAVCVWAAGRIFRVGLLLQGKGAKFGEMISWIFKST